MEVQIDPLILVLDLEQLRLRSKEELLVLLRDHILLIIMGQLRDIKERERLSRGLCREYNLFFEAHDIQVLPHPLSTKQTDARLIAPRKLAHLIGTTTSDMILGRATETRPTPVPPGAPEASESSEQATSPSMWTRLTHMLRFAVLLLAALLPLVGISQGQPRSKVDFGQGSGSMLVSGRSGKRPCVLARPGFAGRSVTEETGRRAVERRVADSSVAVEQSKRTWVLRAAQSRARDFAERLRHRELAAPMLEQPTRAVQARSGLSRRRELPPSQDRWSWRLEPPFAEGGIASSRLGEKFSLFVAWNASIEVNAV